VLVYFVVVFYLQLYVLVCCIVHCIYLRTILIYVVRKWQLQGEIILCVGISHSNSVVTVQHAFRAKYAKDPPADKTIRAWYKQFTETGCLWKQKSSGRPSTADDDDV
jgi:hypothetical protein